MSDGAFASLTPENALARLAFSNLYDSLTTGRQNAQEDDALILRRMVVQPQQNFDSEVLRSRLEKEKRPNLSDVETSESLPEPDTDDENNHQRDLIWTGHYLLNLKYSSSSSMIEFAAGKDPLKNVFIDLLLCTKAFVNEFDINLRNSHARFNFFLTNKDFYVHGCSRFKLTQLTMNDEAAHQRPYHLNQQFMMIRLDKLEYNFRWTSFAVTKDFKEDRARYVSRVIDNFMKIDIDMSTFHFNKRMMGDWTLKNALDVDSQKKIFFASNRLDHAVIIKIIERTVKNHDRVDVKVQRSRDITAFANKWDDSERILRVTEIIYTNEERFSPTTLFDNVAIVMQPMTPKTLTDWLGNRSKG